MVFVEINGRLGNNLFEVAAARSLSDEITLWCKGPWERECIEMYRDTFFKNYPIVNSVPQEAKAYQELSYLYNAIDYDEKEDLVIKGYYQSYKYMNRAKVLEMYPCPEAIKKDIDKRFGDLLRHHTVVSVNVRRGDYLKLPHRHPFVGKKFIQRAMLWFGKDVHFIVSSDDIAWCCRHLGKNDKRIHFLTNSYPLLDLYIQTACHHNIISNSSFSWWGAYLNNHIGQVVIAPHRWYGMSANINISDLLPKEWMIEQCTYEPSVWFTAMFKHLKYLAKECLIR